jgi:hypothetical protein
MAKIRMLTSMAGINFVYSSGDILNVTDAEATRYIEAGIAEGFVSSEPKIERAVKKAIVEKAVKE